MDFGSRSIFFLVVFCSCRFFLFCLCACLLFAAAVLFLFLYRFRTVFLFLFLFLRCCISHQFHVQSVREDKINRQCNFFFSLLLVLCELRIEQMRKQQSENLYAVKFYFLQTNHPISAHHSSEKKN